VSEVASGEDLRATASRLAAAIATNSPTAMRATKKALWRSLEVGMTQARGEAADEIWRLRNHPDHGEGARAWREKRTPRWQPLSDAVEAS